jgi:dihydroorotate dehydrogenase electron transfer subunit
MKAQQATVMWNEPVGPACYRLGLGSINGFTKTKPGQFVMLRISTGVDPLLRRPFSIHRLIRKSGRTVGIEILYKVVGKGTAMLAHASVDDQLNVFGPLGSAFIVPSNVQRIFIVGGGIGIAPLVFLGQDLLNRDKDPAQCQVFIGGRTQGDILCADDFRRLKMRVWVTTDDGSAGDQCLVTHPVLEAIQHRAPDAIYACGPLDMLKCIVGFAEAHSIHCQISIETRMACGMGVCLGCAVASREDDSRFLHACLDGPVFDIRTVQL